MKQKSAKQLSFELKSWGGRRAGAGRKKVRLSEPNHVRREIVSAKTPVHVTLKVQKGLPSLRITSNFQRIAKAIAGARALGLRVVHFSVQSNHIHLLVEANSQREFVRGMRSLTVRLAKAIKKSIVSASDTRRTIASSGKIFLGRYHSRVLRTPIEVKRVLLYVLQNTAKHLGRGKREPIVLDPCSSLHLLEAPQALFGARAQTRAAREFFEGESPPLHRRIKKAVGDYLSKPRSWLLATGWKVAPA